MTSFNTGATAAASNAGSVNITIPAGVLAGDVVFVVAESFSTAAGGALSVSSTGTVPAQIGPTQVATSANTIYGAVYSFVAATGDAGKVITISNTTPPANTWFTVALAAYSGAGLVDVSGGNAAAGVITSVTCPAKTTTVGGDWAVYLGGGAINGSLSGPAGTTQRENLNSSANVAAGIWDSNGSVGPAGTGIGGGTISCGAGTNWLTAFTVGLAPPAVQAAAAGGGMSMLKRSMLLADL